jgi:hypothetical protein
LEMLLNAKFRPKPWLRAGYGDSFSVPAGLRGHKHHASG